MTKIIRHIITILLAVLLVILMPTSQAIDPHLYKASFLRMRAMELGGPRIYYVARLTGAGPVLLGTVRHKKQVDALKQAVAWRQYLIEQYEAELIALGSEVGQ